MAFLALIFMIVSTDAMEPAPGPEPYGTYLLCEDAQVLFETGDHSGAISKLNQCMTEEPLAPRDKACALLNRAKNYLAMDQDDKAAGDADSALNLDPDLRQETQAQACLGGDMDLTQRILNLTAS